MQLIFITHGRGTPLQIADMTALVGNDQGAFELTGIGLVNSKVRGELHGTANAFGDVDKRAVTEDGTVQSRVEIVFARHDAAQMFSNKIRILLHRFRYGAEQHTRFRQFFAESGRYGDRVKHNINGHAGKRLLLVEGNAQFFIGRQQLRVDFIETFGAVFHTFWLGIIGDTLKVDFQIIDVRPIGAHHLTPDLKCPQTPFEQPFRLILFCRDKTNRVFGQAGRQRVGFYFSSESSCIILSNGSVNLFLRHGLFKFLKLTDSER